MPVNRRVPLTSPPDRPARFEHPQLERTSMRRGRYSIAALLVVVGMAPLGAQQPAGTIRRRVTDDATQQPLSGVTVTVGSRRVLTPADGHYLITGVPTGTDTLRTRLIGYASAARPVTVAGGDTVVVDLALTRRAVSLSELGVTGYGEQRARNLTSAASKLPSADFHSRRILSPPRPIGNNGAAQQVVHHNEP